MSVPYLSPGNGNASLCEGIEVMKLSRLKRIPVQLPLPIRKGFLTLHVSVLPLVLPVGSIYHRVDEMEGETIGDAKEIQRTILGQ